MMATKQHKKLQKKNEEKEVHTPSAFYLFIFNLYLEGPAGWQSDTSYQIVGWHRILSLYLCLLLAFYLSGWGIWE